MLPGRSLVLPRLSWLAVSPLICSAVVFLVSASDKLRKQTLREKVNVTVDANGPALSRSAEVRHRFASVRCMCDSKCFSCLLSLQRLSASASHTSYPSEDIHTTRSHYLHTELLGNLAYRIVRLSRPAPPTHDNTAPTFGHHGRQ